MSVDSNTMGMIAVVVLTPNIAIHTASIHGVRCGCSWNGAWSQVRTAHSTSGFFVNSLATSA